MNTVVLERSFDPPLTLDDVGAMAANGSWCLEMHRVRHVTSLLSSDGRRLLCFFAAPDAESVRAVLRQLDLAYETIWPATVHAPAGIDTDARPAVDGASTVVVERSFSDPVELAEIQGLENRGAWCLEQQRTSILRTYFSRDRRRMLCAYAAPDAESVRRAQEQAGMPLERVWTATVLDSRVS